VGPGVGALIVDRAATWTEAERGTLAEVVTTLHPSPRHLTDIFDWLDDIAARDGVRPAAVLADRALQGVLRAGGSAPDRLKRWKETLRRLRYPRLVARERAVAELVRSMHVAGVDVEPPVDLEGGAVTLTIRASSVAELTDALERLRARVADGSVARLFALVDET